MSNHRVVVGLVLLALGGLSFGCGPTEKEVDPQVLALRAKYVLAEEPQGAMSVVAAKAAVEKGEPVVLVGLIGHGEDEPWAEGHAAFYIADAFSPASPSHGHDDANHKHEADEHEADEHEADEHEADEHEADEHEADEHEADEHKADEQQGHAHETHGAGGHDPSNCPFCPKKDSADLHAVVEFVDETGHRLHIDARELLDVKKDQLVVVRGQGKVDNYGYLVVTANGIYLGKASGR